MAKLANKRILLGVTGSIAAYKSAELVRRLMDAGATVQVVMTEAAQAFVTSFTLQTLSGRPVHCALMDADAEATMGHIEQARWADLIVIAPASANFIAKLAQGRADDLLSAICLASAAPLAVAPAMNQQMWANAATQANVATLVERGAMLLGPASGEQACGDVGAGRMLEPDQIVERCAEQFEVGILAGRRVLVTAGPTQEDIDPVRYISNRSSGKMGFAIAAAAAEAGAEVILVSGPVALETPARVSRIDVRSAEQMLVAVQAQSAQDIVIAAAAVADYRPLQVATQKIKKQAGGAQLSLEQTPDILATIAASKHDMFVVGFAAETEHLEKNARLKLEKKSLDLIAANWVGGGRGGFDSDENALTVLWQNGGVELPLASKEKVARLLIEIIVERFDAKDSTENS
ncbi:MAG: bifunctional phosphopantothenoylcysteine decarboxylase/phosphopantothenate--cysteine ligase CoaBC [Thiotrichaceae bacterium]|nr:bifunctional phosphopantothenoylcysteine decarboxylase/phosphopantothenate--cysteine ligase CoaBC [Thiotrichaceae bacterium]PCI10602.1 MAG: bifunctional phosphopantothenoylcysteine decarboxylase/phosphopantothenate--cysteine ligase CoaBC [Thiotrichales bacterium]PCI11783.1 MAG: bifunctional phosphopantothenoylcysteine decarboxylase/phosphopantothenate--cysteine ligase CoaBC [Thiotrichales bacterium]